MPKEIVVVGLVALAGVFVGGAYTMWKQGAKPVAGVLGALAVLAAAGGVAWYLS